MPEPNLHLDPTYGALFIGVLLSAVLFGVTMLQTFVYFQQYPSDRPWRKFAVSWLCFLDALHLALSAHFVYHYLVSNYANPDALSHIVWSFKLRIVIDALVVCSVHTLYTLRLWTLLAIDDHLAPFGQEARRWSQQKVTVHASATLWVMRRIVPWLVYNRRHVSHHALLPVMCYETIKLDLFIDLLHAPWATFVPLGSSTVIDAVIASSLCYFLARCRPQSEPRNGPIKTLIVYTVNTGIITSFCSLITIFMMVAYPRTFIPIAIEFLIIKLYINSYMAMLNARTALNSSQEHSVHHSFIPPLPRGSFRDALEQKRLPFPSFLASASSLQLVECTPAPIPIPSPAPSTHIHPSRPYTQSPNPARRASAPETGPDRGRASPSPTWLVPRLSHPDVSPTYGELETPLGVGVTVPAAASLNKQRFRSFASSSAASSATATASFPAISGVHPLAAAAAAMFADPVDPLTPVRGPALNASGRGAAPPVDGAAAVMIAPSDARSRMADAHPEHTLSPLRFASYSSSAPSCAHSLSPSFALSAPPTPTHPDSSHARPSHAPSPSPSPSSLSGGTPSRPRLPSAYSATAAAGSEDAYTRMVSAVRESRRAGVGLATSTTARAGSRGGMAVSGVEDERGVWMWGAPPGSGGRAG
ncbi:hypothetical protein BD414DRAFT_408500 [Trametes punicea]|nr:hypothetical protein BD414DRAFT_408500 [Trametes punicea]